MTNAPESFEIIAGDPALDFVNTLDNRFVEDGPRELLRSYEDLLRFAAQCWLITTAEARSLGKSVKEEEARIVLRHALELREALATVLYGIVEGIAPPANKQTTHMKILDHYFKAAMVDRQLTWTSAKGAPHFAWALSEHDPKLPVSALALAGSQLITSELVSEIRSCSSETCRWLFLDNSKNHTRRWCAMKICGNRMKARRHKSRTAV